MLECLLSQRMYVAVGGNKEMNVGDSTEGRSWSILTVLQDGGLRSRKGTGESFQRLTGRIVQERHKTQGGVEAPDTGRCGGTAAHNEPDMLSFDRSRPVGRPRGR